jgi:hypothetical protein
MFDADENADRNGRRILWMTLCGGMLPDVNGMHSIL